MMQKKRLGQVFLKDKNILRIIAENAEIQDGEIILEIGPGPGNLTKELLSRGAKVISIEKSKEYYDLLSTILNDEIEKGKLKVINADALKIDFPKFDKIVSNIPYNISSPLTFKLLNYDFKMGIIMYQKEFAKRLVAKPGNKDYSRLSVNMYYFADAEIIRNVPRSCFNPVPDVDSALVKILPRKKFSVKSEKAFFDIVKELFSQRRKKIRNILKMHNIPFEDRRPEELTPEEFGILSDFLYENKYFDRKE
ncbi:MAG: 16S rRNA (adenine(1518)-N(6)/adenine(1519)-N(6))-dimethyltransferase RsmA [Thermoplasmata archaeon]|nr:16S rRNA (adenine(1518)-N(6)/adenine(1519)-N(6))-dimethyltransferase RsmA [Thermoplasmata archaeon]